MTLFLFIMQVFPIVLFETKAGMLLFRQDNEIFTSSSWQGRHFAKLFCFRSVHLLWNVSLLFVTSPITGHQN